MEIRKMPKKQSEMIPEELERSRAYNRSEKTRETIRKHYEKQWKEHKDDPAPTQEEVKEAFQMTEKDNHKHGGSTYDHLEFHPTVKPLQLFEYLVRLITPPNGIVIDPFIGTGTTALACRNQGFKYIGFDKHAPYVQIALARLSQTEVFKVHDTYVQTERGRISQTGSDDWL